MTLILFEKSRGSRPWCHGLSDLCRHQSGWVQCDHNMDWSDCKSAPLHVVVQSHLSGSSAIQPLAAISAESWHRLLFFFISTGADYSFLFFLTGMSWKLHSRVHGQIHLATQFTNGVIFKWHFQNFPLEAGFLVVRGKKNETPPPIPRITTELEVRELSQSDFWDISSHPTSVLSFSQISWS